MTTVVTGLWRYPVKGLGGERLLEAALTPEHGMTDDRRFALKPEGSKYDADYPRWKPKSEFLQMARDPGLVRVHAGWDREAGQLTFIGDHGRGARVTANPSTDGGRARLEDFLRHETVGTDRRPGEVLIERPGIIFSDVGRPVISIISLATILALERVIAKPIDPRRFRGNIVIATDMAWLEMAWIGHEITIGAARLKVVEPIGRCKATTLDPRTGISDVQIPQLLRQHFGHNKCGVYAEVLSAGIVRTGDGVGRVS